MEEDRSGDHITPPELGIGTGRKSDALSPIFMGKLPPVPKDGGREGGELMGVEEEEEENREVGEFGGPAGILHAK